MKQVRNESRRFRLVLHHLIDLWAKDNVDRLDSIEDSMDDDGGKQST
jgi:hypothetical protein